jgi:phage baseplate assembly protein W
MFMYKHFVRGHALSEVDDVIRNLNYVLTTKRGYGYFLETFGLTDATFRTTEEMVIGLSAEISENIRLYETRVELVDIDEVYDDAKRPRLVVSLRLRDQKEKLKLVVNLADRSFDIRPVLPKEGKEGKGT